MSAGLAASRAGVADAPAAPGATGAPAAPGLSAGPDVPATTQARAASRAASQAASQAAPRAAANGASVAPGAAVGLPGGNGAARRPSPAAGRQPSRREGRVRGGALRAAGLACAVAVVIIAGLVGTGPSGDSVTASVKAFLLDWENGDYAAAAAMTTGDHAVVAAALRSTYRQLGAEDLILGMGPLAQSGAGPQPITVRGDTARVIFNATIDLGRGGLIWRYQGAFTMRRGSTGWRVVWAPSVIVPGLGPGERLAVVTTTPRRAALLDSAGRPLLVPSRVVQVGVIPATVTSPARTARRLAAATGLPLADADEMASQIQAWPPRSFLELVQLSPSGYARLRAALRQVPGLRVRDVTRRLFVSTVPAVTGTVGTEIAKVLIADGQPYQPGATVGLSGLEQAYQAELAGTATTEVIVQDRAGRRVAVLGRWPGRPGRPVRTTIDAAIQRAAQRAVAGAGTSAAVVAVNSGGGNSGRTAAGRVLAVATGRAGGMPAVSPLTGGYQPGQAFTVISAAALLASGSVGPGNPVPCHATNQVGGQTFSNVPAVHLRANPTFASDFAHACSTAFVGPSLYLSGPRLTAVARQFGIGAPWRLPVPAFAGYVGGSAGQGQLAAEVIGGGTVRVSPLDMALAAAAADSGFWAPPSLVAGAPPRPSPVAALRGRVAGQLRALMGAAVRSGAAAGARMRGLYGQVGVAPLPGHRGIRAVWFVGYRGSVAFAVMVLSRSASFWPAIQVARAFAAGLPGR